MYRHRINPRKAAQGTVQSFNCTNTGVCALYNDSKSKRLAVWSVISNPGATIPLGVYPLHGTLTTLVGPGTVIWTNQGSIDGQLYKDDLASPGLSVGGNITAFQGGFFPTSVPIWILDPGWSLVIVANQGSGTFGASYFWESLSSLAFPPFREAYDFMGPDLSS